MIAFIAAPEALIMIVVVMVFFGAKKLPELARSAAQARREFDDAKSDKSSLPERLP
ncbi:MAG: twin-arginine translocase TatA/TatE family subunit [Acidimicrobiales bacterium]